jgi:TonB family protein
MKPLISFLLVIIFFSSSAQTKVVTYLDKDWKTVTDSTKASFYRTVEQTLNGYTVRDYYISGKIRNVFECTEVSPSLKRNGKFISYYENGNIEEEGTYKSGMGTGLFKTYYEDGKPKQETMYEGKMRYLHYWTKDGVDELADGEGLIEGSSTAENKTYQAIRNFSVVESFGVHRITGDTVYTLVETMPEYPGGYGEMMMAITRAIQYPESARKQGIKGTIFVEFIISRQGKTGEIKVLRGINAECDAEAVKAISKLKNWTPGKKNGKPVAVKTVLPVNFHLE